MERSEAWYALLLALCGGADALSACLVAYYKDRGGALVGLKGENLGHCTPDEGAQFWCSKGISRVQGTRKLNCKSPIWARDLDN